MGNEIIKFKAIIDKKVKDTPNFKMYGVSPITNVDLLNFNQYGNVSINGDLMELTLGMEYDIEASANKYGYEVLKIKRDKPTTKQQTVKFLTEVITQRQAETLLSVYPDIVEKVIGDKLDDINLSKLHGIKEKTFNNIKAKIIENFPLIDFIEEFSAYGISLGMAKKMYDTFSSIERMKERMNDNPYATLCSISGIGFKKADSMILSVPKNKDLYCSITRMNSCIKFLLEESEGNGNTWIGLLDLYEQCLELVPESIDLFLEGLVDDTLYVDQKSKRISSKVSYMTEVYIAKQLLDILENSNQLQIEYSKYFTIDGMELSEEQKILLKNFCKYNLNLLVGNAGSGKSFCTQSLIQLCDENKLSYLLMTPTGKSAMVLSEYTNRDAGTIHRKLGYNPAEGWTYNRDNKLPYDVVIVDENGMTDIFLMKHLLEAIDTTNTRLIFVQDDAQLSSVGCGNCAYDMITSKIIPITRLTKTFRFGEGGLLNVATKIRMGQKYIDNSCEEITVFGTKSDYSLIPVEDDSILDYVIGIYDNLLKQGNSPLDILVLTSKNVHANGSVEINKILQEKFNPHSDIKPYKIFGSNVFRLGDIVMQCKNNYKAINEYEDEVTITNGDIGKVVNIKYNVVYVKYNKHIISYEHDDLDQISLAYSISIHKSQGSGVRNVILITPVSHKWNLNKNLIYVGVTRAKEKCYHLSLPSTINYAIKKSAELNRNTFLLELLQSNNLNPIQQGGKS